MEEHRTSGVRDGRGSAADSKGKAPLQSTSTTPETQNSSLMAFYHENLKNMYKTFKRFSLNSKTAMRRKDEEKRRASDKGSKRVNFSRLQIIVGWRYRSIRCIKRRIDGGTALSGVSREGLMEAQLYQVYQEKD